MPTKFKDFISATGRRKRAIARIRLYQQSGPITINGKEVSEPNPVWVQPLKVADAGVKRIDIKVAGGGRSAQNQAIRLGIARTLLERDPKLRKTFREMGFLTRDPREKERKKPGLKRARRAPQWQKR